MICYLVHQFFSQFMNILFWQCWSSIPQIHSSAMKIRKHSFLVKLKVNYLFFANKLFVQFSNITYDIVKYITTYFIKNIVSELLSNTSRSETHETLWLLAHPSSHAQNPEIKRRVLQMMKWKQTTAVFTVN